MNDGSWVGSDPPGLPRHGFSFHPDWLTGVELDSMRGAMETFLRSEPDQTAPGTRDLLRRVPLINEFARGRRLAELLTPVLGPQAVPVRALFFNKSPTANWKVPWHQDLSIAVGSRQEIPGYGPWSVKAGVPHVQPPAKVLEKLLTVRVHLDDTDADNGALRVIPGSHVGGKLSPTEIINWRRQAEEVVCTLGAGGVLLMRPLLLHASAPARVDRLRRVVHLEYAPAEAVLPAGLHWYG